MEVPGVFLIEEGKPGDIPRFEFHQNIDIALRTEIVTQHRPEKRQLANVMFPAESFDICFFNLNCHIAHKYLE